MTLMRLVLLIGVVDVVGGGVEVGDVTGVLFLLS